MNQHIVNNYMLKVNGNSVHVDMLKAELEECYELKKYAKNTSSKQSIDKHIERLNKIIKNENKNQEV